MPEPFAVIGTVVDSNADWSLNVEEDAVILVGHDGTIRHRGKAYFDLADAFERYVACKSVYQKV